MLFASAAQAQVFERRFVNGEVAHCRAVFGSHVGDCRSVGKRQLPCAFAEEFHEFAHDLFLSEHLRNEQREVRRHDALRQFARNVHAHNFGHFEVHGLSEHARFRLDSADAPAYDAKPVNHRCVGVRAHERVGVEDCFAVLFALEDEPRKVLHVDLVDNARRGRHDRKRLERLLPPFEEFVSFAVAFELLFEVLFESFGDSRAVHLHRVVYNQVHGHERLYHRGVFALFCGGVAHCREVYEQRNSREVLQNDSRNDEGNFVVAGVCRVPRRELFDVGFRCAVAVAVSEHAFEHNLYAHGQSRHVEARFFKLFEAVYITLCAAFFRRKLFQCIERIFHVKISSNLRFFRRPRSPPCILRRACLRLCRF